MGLSHTVSGDIASFRTPSRVPIESLKFRFLPKQAAGTPSPENPIPIEGWIGLNGYGAGLNLISLSDFDYIDNSSNIDLTITDSTMKILCKKNGNDWLKSSQEAKLDIPKAWRGKPIYFGVESITLETENKDYQRSTIVCEFRDENNTFITDPTVVSVGDGSTTYARKYTIPSNAAVMKIYFRIAQNINTYGVSVGDYIIFNNFYMRYPSDTYGYTKYEGEQIPITFPDGETIYGGYVDLVRGKLVATWEVINKPLSQWTHSAPTSIRYYTDFAHDMKCVDDGVYGNSQKCNIAPFSWSDTDNTNPHFFIGRSSSKGRAYLYLPADYDGSQVIQVAAKLVTPIEYDIDPVTLQAFLDHNNFWSDANDITEVTYAVAESKDILTIRKKAQSFNDYFQGELVFELNGDDPPVDGAWVDRVNGMDYRLAGGASYDDVNKIYDFSGRGIGVHDVLYRDPFNIGHHFRIEWDIYFRRVGTSNGHFFDLGSLGTASTALGIGLLSKNANTITFNWKMQGNSSNPFGVSGEVRTNPNTPVEGDTNYTHFVGFHEIIPWNDGYDRLRIMVNGRISRYETQIPKVEYTQWKTSNNHFSVGAGVYNWNVDDRPDQYDKEYETDVKVRSIKIYKYD